MKINWIALRVYICGLTLAAACFARLVYVERTRDDSTFHLSTDTSTPAILMFIGLGVAFVAFMIAVVGWGRPSEKSAGRPGGRNRPAPGSRRALGHAYATI